MFAVIHPMTTLYCVRINIERMICYLQAHQTKDEAASGAANREPEAAAPPGRTTLAPAQTERQDRERAGKTSAFFR